MKENFTKLIEEFKILAKDDSIPLITVDEELEYVI